MTIAFSTVVAETSAEVAFCSCTYTPHALLESWLEVGLVACRGVCHLLLKMSSCPGSWEGESLRLSWSQTEQMIRQTPRERLWLAWIPGGEETGLAEWLGLPAKCKFTSRDPFQSRQRNVCLGMSLSGESTKQSVCVNLAWRRVIVLSQS